MVLHSSILDILRYSQSSKQKVICREHLLADPPQQAPKLSQFKDNKYYIWPRSILGHFIPVGEADGNKKRETLGNETHQKLKG